MPLSNVIFQTDSSGLGRLPATEDHISAMVLRFGAAVSAAVGGVSKKYLSLQQAESDGIIRSNPETAILWYHIHEYFRMAGASELYIVDSNGLTPQGLYAATNGDARQIYIESAENDFAGLPAIVSDVVKPFSDFLELKFAPAVFITCIESTNMQPYEIAAPDLTLLDASTISIVASGDAGGIGNEIATDLGILMIPMVGTVLGALSKAQVHMNIGWVDRFPLASGLNFQNVVFSGGVNVRNTSDANLVLSHDKGYMFARPVEGVSGTFINDTKTCTLPSSDFHTLENVRTMQKAQRSIRTALIPDLNSPLLVDNEGRLEPSTIAYFTNKCTNALATMQNAGEISAYDVFIDDNQDVVTTSKLVIQAKIVPVGVARQIVVNIGFALAV